MTVPQRELSEDEKAELDRRIAPIAAHLGDNSIVTVEYFVPDSRNDGGEYRAKTGEIERISQAKRVVVVGGESIRVNRIVRHEVKDLFFLETLPLLVRPKKNISPYLRQRCDSKLTHPGLGRDDRGVAIALRKPDCISVSLVYRNNITIILFPLVFSRAYARTKNLNSIKSEIQVGYL